MLQAGSIPKKLVWIVIIALVIRVIASCFMVASYAEKWADPHDGHWTYAYEVGRVAQSLAEGRGFSDPLKIPSGPTAWLPPVYPLILAGVFKIFGIYSTASALAIRVFNSVVTSLTCVPVFFIARRFGKRTGMWAAWGWALFPHGVWAAAAVNWDLCLSAFILCCLVWMTLELRNGAPVSMWVGYGALWGIGELTNATMIAALPFLLGWLWWQDRSFRRSWILRPAVSILACLAVMAPWLIRNYRVFHQPFLVKSNLWLEFVVGNSVHQTSFSTGDLHPDGSSSELREFVERGEMRYMAEKKKVAMDFLRQHPALYLWLCVRRFVYVWTGFWSFSHEYLASNADGGYRHIAFMTAYLIPFLMGLRRAFRLQPNMGLLLAAVLFSVPFATYITHPGFYRFLVDPEMVVLGAYGIAPLLSPSGAKWRWPAHRAKLFRPASSPGNGAAV